MGTNLEQQAHRTLPLHLAAIVPTLGQRDALGGRAMDGRQAGVGKQSVFARQFQPLSHSLVTAAEAEDFFRTSFQHCHCSSLSSVSGGRGGPFLAVPDVGNF
jgi:hypothetical protein